jgi:hypothetical protein
MEVQLNGPVTITLNPNTMAMVLDILARNLPYNVGKQIIEVEIFPQLVKGEKKDATDGGTVDTSGARDSRPNTHCSDSEERHEVGQAVVAGSPGE